MTKTEEPYEAKKNRGLKLEAGNERSYRELREATGGRFSMDTGDMRRELFIGFLVEWGVITEEQKLDFDIEFHERVEKALNDAWAQFREAQKPQLSVVQKPSALVDKSGRPLGK